MNINSQLKIIRTDKGISIRTLAAMSNVQPFIIKSFEEKNTNITMKTLYQLIAALNVSCQLRNNIAG